MNISWTFYAAWIFTAIASACVAVEIIRQGLVAKWPALLALMLDEVLAFAVLSLFSHHYAIFFYAYWWNAALVSVARIWLAFDIARSMPAHQLFPRAARRAVLLFASAAGAMCWWALNQPFASSPILTGAAIIARSALFTWMVMLIAALAVVFKSGFGFDISSVRIISGTVLRLFSFCALSAISIWALHRPLIIRYANLADTTVAGLIACYFWYAINKHHVEEAREADDYFHITQNLEPSGERKG